MSEETIQNPIEGLDNLVNQESEQQETQPEDTNTILLRELANLKQELADTRKQVSHVDETISQARTLGVNQQTAALQAAIQKARSEGNFDAYEQYNQQLKAIQTQTPSTPAPNPAFNSFMRAEGFEGKLYKDMNEDEKDRHDYAIMQEKRYRVDHRIPLGSPQDKESEVYNYVTHKLRARFAEKYASTNRNEAPAMTHANQIKKQVSAPSFDEGQTLRNLEPGEKEYHAHLVDNHQFERAKKYLQKIHDRRQAQQRSVGR